MITLRRAAERLHERHCTHEAWSTFRRSDRADPLANGFGALEILTETCLKPGAALPRPPDREVDVLTYVHEGMLAYDDLSGHTFVLHAGQFQRSPNGRGFGGSETNASQTHDAHLLEIGLSRPSGAGDLGHEVKRVTAAERRSRLRVVASYEARPGAMRIHQNVSVFSAIIEPGQHIVHELRGGRRAWLHVVRGEIALGDITLTSGDGAGIVAERAVSLTARESGEVLLIDLGETRLHDDPTLE